jgi:hypothetical protein
MDKEHLNAKPILLIDVDGVISLFGFAQRARPAGSFHSVNGVPHYISERAGTGLARLADHFELVWATGWEETANEYLPALLGLPAELPYLRFDDYPEFGRAHWKLAAIDAYCGDRRALAWIDDCHDEACRDWAAGRPGPTLLVPTQAGEGMLESHVDELIGWAGGLARLDV